MGDIARQHYDAALTDAAHWALINFGQLTYHQACELAKGVAVILYPHLAVAALADMSDGMADRYPDIAKALDQLADEQRSRILELTRKAP